MKSSRLTISLVSALSVCFASAAAVAAPAKSAALGKNAARKSVAAGKANSLVVENGRTARVFVDGEGAPTTHIVAAPGGRTLAIGPATAIGSKGFGFVTIDGVVTDLHFAVFSAL